MPEEQEIAIPFDSDEYLDSQAVQDVDGWINAQEQYQAAKDKFENSNRAFKAICGLGGLRLEDFINAL